MNDYPTEQEVHYAANILRRLPRGFLPFEVFIAFAERTVMPCLELSLFRRHGDEIEILLTKREADDPHFPDAWHLPGGVLRATDKEGDFSSILERTLQGELRGEHLLLYEPQYAITRFQETARGRELVLEYFSEVTYSDATPTEGCFFSIDSLPRDLLDQYLVIIPETAKAFQSYTAP
jgi:ADP-ribose pyrophosphatase YjhB (NUDIX family)